MDSVASKFDKTEALLQLIVDSLKGIERRLDSIEGRLDAVERRLDAIESRLDAMDARFDATDRYFEETMQSIAGVHNDFRESVTRNEELIANHEHRITRLENVAA